jgi:hypothetical protein
LDDAANGRILADLLDQKGNGPVSQDDSIPCLEFVNQPVVRRRELVRRRKLLPPNEPDPLARHTLHLAVRQFTQPDLRTGQIHQDGNHSTRFPAGGTDRRDSAFVLFPSTMSRVDSKDIDSRIDKLEQLRPLTASRPYGGNDLRLTRTSRRLNRLLG